MLNKINIRRIVLALSVVGLLDSLYLTWVKLSGSSAFCAGVGDCDTVNASEFSEFWGIPIAILGALAYLIIIVFTILENRSTKMEEFTPYVLFGLSFVGVIYSAYLTYIEISILYAICPYCVISAIVLTLIFFLSVIRLFRHNGDEL